MCPTHSRRAFLLQLARGAAYAAPVVMTLAAPDPARADRENFNSRKGGMGMRMRMRMRMGDDDDRGERERNDAPVSTPGFGISAPWSGSAPGG